MPLLWPGLYLRYNARAKDVARLLNFVTLIKVRYFSPTIIYRNIYNLFIFCEQDIKNEKERDNSLEFLGIKI